MKIEDNYYIHINRILPPPALEDFYVEVDSKNDISITRTILPGTDKLFQWRIIKSGNILVIKNRDNS